MPKTSEECRNQRQRGNIVRLFESKVPACKGTGECALTQCSNEIDSPVKTEQIDKLNNDGVVCQGIVRSILNKLTCQACVVDVFVIRLFLGFT